MLKGLPPHVQAILHAYDHTQAHRLRVYKVNMCPEAYLQSQS